MIQGPAFQLYAKDFYAGTAHFSGAELGAYIRGLTWSWDNGPLPADHARIARIFLVDQREFRKVWPVVSEKWDLGDNGYTNARLEEVRQEQVDYRHNRSDNGRIGAKKRWAKKPKTDSTANGSAIAQPMAQPSVSQWQNDSPPPAPPTPEDQNHLRVEGGQAYATEIKPSPTLAPHKSYGRNGNHATNLMPGNYEHGSCGYPPACTIGVCVKRTQHQEFTSRLSVTDGRGPNGWTLTEFYAATVAEWRATRVPGGKCYAIWDTRFEAWIGSEPKPRAGKETLGVRAIRAANEFSADLHARQSERPLTAPRPLRQIVGGE